jgi:hypothetical protein
MIVSMVTRAMTNSLVPPGMILYLRTLLELPGMISFKATMAIIFLLVRIVSSISFDILFQDDLIAKVTESRI